MNNFQDYYEKKSITYNIKDKRLKKILELALPVKNKIILDIGCSTGYLGSILEKKGAKVIGIDISQKAIKKAKKVLTDAKVLDLNSQKLPFTSSSIDAVIASEIIEHLFQPLLFLKEAKRVLKTNGIFIVTTPNFLYWGNRINFMKGTFGYTREGVFDEGHIHFYTHETLVQDLSKSGFEVVEENHVYPGSMLLKFKNLFPGLFAYQFVAKTRLK